MMNEVAGRSQKHQKTLKCSDVSWFVWVFAFVRSTFDPNATFPDTAAVGDGGAKGSRRISVSVISISQLEVKKKKKKRETPPGT